MEILNVILKLKCEMENASFYSEYVIKNNNLIERKRLNEIKHKIKKNSRLIKLSLNGSERECIMIECERQTIIKSNNVTITYGRKASLTNNMYDVESKSERGIIIGGDMNIEVSEFESCYRWCRETRRLEYTVYV